MTFRLFLFWIAYTNPQSNAIWTTNLLGLAGFGGGESGASSTDSEECEARTPPVSFPGSPVNKERSFGVKGISVNKSKIFPKSYPL